MKKLKLFFQFVSFLLLSNFEATFAQEFTFEREIDTIPVIVNAEALKAPFAGGIFGSNPAVADIDDDGDLDLFIGKGTVNAFGTVDHYENTGTATSPSFSIRTATFASAILGVISFPTFADIDNDGDVDFFVGEGGGTIRFYRNTGTRTNPNFTLETANFASIDVGIHSAPVFVDIDADGDLDLFVGEAERFGEGGGGNINFYRNEGTATNFNFILETENFASIDIGTSSMPNFADIDNDGDFDLFVGGSGGVIYFYRNTGSEADPNFSLETQNFASINVGSFNAAPAFADIDDDGDLDLLVGEGVGNINFFRNIGNSTIPSFSLETEEFVTPSAIEVGFTCAPALADIDNDEDLDLFLGTSGGKIYFYRNSGTSANPNFILETKNFASVDVSLINSVPAFADIDNDGDLDFFVGEGGGNLNFYRNSGTSTNPNFILETESFASIFVGANSSPTFTDIDDDGDLDLFVGEGDGELNFYRNNGTAADPNFTLETEKFASIDIGFRSNPAFADIDNDGDLDLFVGSNNKSMHFYRNSGTATSPIFFFETDNFASIFALIDMHPLFGDIDNDGDLDLFMGERAGGIYFYRNVTSPSTALFTDINAPLTPVSSGDVAWGDYDSDGDLDLVLTGRSNNNPVTQTTEIYRNNGASFVVETSQPSLDFGDAVAWGDYDNDGDLDILSALGVFRNDAGSFVDISAPLTSVFFASVAWGDYDNDGDLDILSSGTAGPGPPEIADIYRNDSGNFANINAQLAGVSGSAVAWGDYDSDGDLDLVLSGDTNPILTSNVYRNDDGKFVDISAPLIPVELGSVAWGDYDNDGDLDILLTGDTHAEFVSKIYRNTNSGFVDANVSLPGVGESDAKWGDYDNDGDPDILLTGDTGAGFITKIFRNDNGSFVDINAQLTGVHNSSVAWGDYDNDGDLDILLIGETDTSQVAKIYRNNIGIPNTVPTAPANLAATVSGNDVTLTWDRATDSQTAQSSLTYNLRIGTTPGGLEIMTPMADGSSGFRRVPALGNANHNPQWTIKSLPDGTYYWSVQAVDNAFAGSLFAPEQSFTVGGAPPAPPSDLVATVISATQIDLTWKDNSDNETRFRIRRKEGTQDFDFLAVVGADTTSYMDKTVKPNTSYVYRIQAQNDAGKSILTTSNQVTTPSAAAPNAPTNLQATVVSATQIDLTWQDNSDNETQFSVERQVEDSSFTLLSMVGPDTTAFSDKTVSPNTRYTYRIRAENDAGNSSYATSNVVTTPDLPPNAPSNLEATVISATQIDLTWKDNSNNETRFRIRRKEGTKDFEFLADVGADTTNYMDKKVQPNTSYVYRIQARNDAGASSFATSNQVTTPNVPPNAPTNLQATVVSATQIDLTWQDNSDNETHFNIERKTEGNSFSLLATVGADTTAFVDQTVNPNTRYTYRVRAENSTGNSSYATSNAVTTPDVPPQPPSNLRVTVISATRIDLTWQDNSDNETHFNIERKTEGSSFSLLATVGADTTAFTDQTVDPSTQYTYRVRAENAARSSAYSNEASATTPALNGPVANFSATPLKGEAPLTVVFTDASTPGDAALTSWAWDFDNDGTIDSQQQNPSYTYTIAGRYTVSLTVTDANALSHTATKNQFINVTKNPPPEPPQNLQAVAGDQQVTLTWDANTESDFLRYRIYGGTVPMSTTVIDSVEGSGNTTKIITNLTNETTYYFRMTAVDSALSESSFSNEVSATPEAPRLVAELAIPDTSAAPNATVEIPIRISDATNIAAAEMTVAFNANILTALGAKTTILTTGFTLVDSVSSGQIALSLAKSTGLNGGRGNFLNVTFRVNANAGAGAQSALALQKVTLLDENSDTIPVSTTNGLFTVLPAQTLTVLPNPFTPNGDGFNDYVDFTLPGVQNKQPEVLIFSRSGKRIKILSASEGTGFRWDGTDDDGKALAPGVYIYFIKNIESPLANGTITLMR